MKQMIDSIIYGIYFISYYFFIIGTIALFAACFITVGRFPISDTVYDLLCKLFDFLKTHNIMSVIINVFFNLGCAAFVLKIMNLMFKFIIDFMTWFAEIRWK